MTPKQLAQETAQGFEEIEGGDYCSLDELKEKINELESQVACETEG